MAAAGLLWIGHAGSSSVSVDSDLTTLGIGPLGAPTTPLATTPVSSTTFAITDNGAVDVSDQRLRVHDNDDADTLAGALRVRAGFVVTSGRALHGARDVTISWGDSSEAGTVIGYDEVTDVSVIQLATDAPEDETADATAVATGDTVSLADPDAYATRTVVNAASTSARQNGEKVIGIVELDGTLGAVPPGSPAFDADGAIIGMVTSTAEDAPAAVVPIELVRGVADEIIDNGIATHPWLGVRARNPDDADPMAADGSLVTAVTANGPAAEGGLEVGDLIVEIDGVPITSMESMVATLRSHEPGDQVEVVALRNGEPFECSVDLDSHVEQAA